MRCKRQMALIPHLYISNRGELAGNVTSVCVYLCLCVGEEHIWLVLMLTGALDMVNLSGTSINQSINQWHS